MNNSNFDDTTLDGRIKRLVFLKGERSLQSFLLKSNVPPPRYSMLIRRDGKLSALYINRILEFCPEVNRDWLVDGTGPIKKGDQASYDGELGSQLRRGDLVGVVAKLNETLIHQEQAIEALKKSLEAQKEMTNQLLQLLSQQK